MKGRQVGVRVSPELYRALQADADAHGRTVAASARDHLEAALQQPAQTTGGPDAEDA